MIYYLIHNFKFKLVLEELTDKTEVIKYQLCYLTQALFLYDTKIYEEGGIWFYDFKKFLI